MELLVMNVAPSTSTALRPFPVMTARNGETVEKGADSSIPSQQDTTDPLVNRYPTIAFSYDVDASRLVMQYRDPANGKTVSQIPTEAALKQYKEAQQQEKEASRAAAFEVTVGGSDKKGQSGGTDSSTPNSSTSQPMATGNAQSASTGSAHVAHFTTAATHPASVSSGVARVNVVI
ncbi:hypothetical protein [Azospirillum cavernae]|nr:hypothetical protein [Azospirillum cavernae]